MTFLSVLGILAFIVFLVLWAIALIKKNGKAKKMALWAAVSFLVFIIAGVAGLPAETDKKPKAENTTTSTKEDAKQASVPVSQPNESTTKKQTALLDTSLPFEKFASTYYTLSADKQKEAFDSVRNQVVKWSGVVIEAGSSSLYVYGKPADYNGESWSEISEGKKKLGDVIVVKVSDRSELNGLNQGDIVSFSGELGSRGVKGESNWKLYNGKIEGRTVAEPQNSGTITKAKYNKIKNGMTYEEVAKIIGGPGEALSEVGEKGDKYYTVMYSYKGEGGLGANANFTFQGNKLQAKAQFGLE
ncbi:DUF3862 domain-containing protein [Paenibacillus polymyxa]|uniref:DUF3862 domain-containing protein n=1 Tax=Paenibacillus polymyxa TaxID=1406 RepID=A0AAP4EC52_PAEPO|nr:DUF3862 domain-containing protein [Paenibacillus polymyxa]MDH2334307.1 DUF3862 domain-containing protein [Paenibacillus polymyxa]